MSKFLRYLPCAVVLETMWGDPRDIAPGWFRINPHNFSGKRLYSLIGHSNFLVTNACRECVGHARLHGTPDPDWLERNLRRLQYGRLILGGKVAQQTFERQPYLPKCEIIYMPHPAARTWTKAALQSWRERLSI